MKSSLSTSAAVSSRDAAADCVPVGRTYKLGRLGRTIPARPADRNLEQAQGEVERLSSNLALSSVVKQRAARVCEKAHSRGLIKGRARSTVAAACVYLACRELSIPRTLKDIVVASAQTEKLVARAYRVLLRELDVKPPLPDACGLLRGIASAAGVSEKTERKAVEILKGTKNSSVGKSPRVLAAAALRAACLLEGETVSQKKIASFAGVTRAAIGRRHGELKKEVATRSAARESGLSVEAASSRALAVRG